MLKSLEQTRERLTDRFPRQVEGLTVILHDTPASLLASAPMLGVLWAATGPRSRRYVNGFVSRHELHVLSPAALRERADRIGSGSGAEQMLEFAPSSLYVRRVIMECNRDLYRSLTPSSIATSVRWAWMLEGVSRWFSGETSHARAPIAHYLRQGQRPSFPPSVRDAPLLGGTVIDLLVRTEGERAAVELAGRLHPDGSRAALTKAFGGRPLVHAEGDWRSHLSRLASGNV